MTAWLLLSTVALADDAARLLGPEPTNQAAAATFPSTSLAGLWPLVLAGAVAAGIWAWQRRPRGDGTLETATVENVGRHSLGGTNTLHLVDVEDRNGRVRRLVVATGNQGVTLLADLGNEAERIRDDTAARAAEPRENQLRFDDRREPWNRREDRREDRREQRGRDARGDDPRDAPPLRADDPRRVTTQERRAQALSLIDEVVGNNANNGNNDARRGRNSVRA
jgi:flagellar biogenesis protein FliO